jgi:hypothetical protein
MVRRIIAPLLVLLLLGVRTVQATTVVLVQEGGSLFIGADSLRNLNDFSSTTRVCKVRVERDVIVTMAGTVAGTVVGVDGLHEFSSDLSLTVVQAVAFSSSVEARAEEIGRAFGPEYLPAKRLEMAVVGIDGDGLRVALRTLAADSSRWRLTREDFNGFKILGIQRAFDAMSPEDRRALLQLPAAALIDRVIRAEIREADSLVGLPINIVELTKDGTVKWVRRSPLCPESRATLTTVTPSPELFPASSLSDVAALTIGLERPLGEVTTSLSALELSSELLLKPSEATAIGLSSPIDLAATLRSLEGVSPDGLAGIGFEPSIDLAAALGAPEAAEQPGGDRRRRVVDRPGARARTDRARVRPNSPSDLLLGLGSERLELRGVLPTPDPALRGLDELPLTIISNPTELPSPR